MTISSATRKAGPFLGNGFTTSFPFTFKVFAKTDLAVTRLNAAGVETVLVLDSDYSVTLNPDQDSNPGGSITHPLVGSPLAIGSQLTVSGSLVESQPTDITNLGGFYPQVIEDALDRSVILTQQLRELSDRSIKFPVSDNALVAELPTAAIRAGKTMVFDGAGNITASAVDAAGLGDLIKVTFVGGVDFAAGFSTTLTLPSDPISKSNVAVIFNDKWQQQTGFSLSGTTLTFGTAIPVGTTQVEVVYSVPLPIGVPSAGSITVEKFNQDVSALNAIRTALDLVGISSNDTLTGQKTFTEDLVMSGSAVLFSRADVAAHVTSANIWVANFVKLTGTAITITDFADAPQAGAEVEVYLDAAHTLVHSANLILRHAVNYTAKAGDRLRVRASTSSIFIVEIIQAYPFATMTETVGWSASPSSTVAITPASLAGLRAYAVNGYQAFAGGLIKQWGRSNNLGDLGSGAKVIDLTLPMAFPANVLTVMPSITVSGNYNGVVVTWDFTGSTLATLRFRYAEYAGEAQANLYIAYEAWGY